MRRERQFLDQAHVRQMETERNPLFDIVGARLHVSTEVARTTSGTLFGSNIGISILAGDDYHLINGALGDTASSNGEAIRWELHRYPRH